METLIISSLDKLKGIVPNANIVGIELYNPFEDTTKCHYCEKEFITANMDWVQIDGFLACNECYNKEKIIEVLGNEHKRQGRRYRQHFR